VLNQRENHSHLWGMAGTVEIDLREDQYTMIYTLSGDRAAQLFIMKKVGNFMLLEFI
jgi:hypothetical protein